MRIEVEREEDDRYIAGIPAIPDAIVYGKTAKEAMQKGKSPVLRILADRIDAGEDSVEFAEVFTVSA